LIAERGVTVVANDYLEIAQPIIPSAAIYLRLIGEHQRFPDMNAEQFDTTERLTWWADRVNDIAVPNATVYVTLNNDYAGYSVATAERLKRVVGLPVSNLTNGDVSNDDPAEPMLF